MRVRHEVTSVDTKKKTVKVKNLSTGEEFEESYDKLILSPGAKPVKPAMTGVDTDRVFTLRTVEDTLRIHKFIAENDVKSAVIAGGGYIGLEMAENLTEKGSASPLCKGQIRSWLLSTTTWPVSFTDS